MSKTYKEGLATQGRKGEKLSRINMAFTPSNLDFVRTMAAIRGQTITKYMNEMIARERQNNGEAYNKAKEIIQSQDNR